MMKHDHWVFSTELFTRALVKESSRAKTTFERGIMLINAASTLLHHSSTLQADDDTNVAFAYHFGTDYSVFTSGGNLLRMIGCEASLLFSRRALCTLTLPLCSTLTISAILTPRCSRGNRRLEFHTITPPNGVIPFGEPSKPFGSKRILRADHFPR